MPCGEVARMRSRTLATSAGRSRWVVSPRSFGRKASAAAEAPSASTFAARVARFARASAVSAPARVSCRTSPASRCGWRRTKAKAA